MFAMCDGVSLDEMVILARKILREYILKTVLLFFYLFLKHFFIFLFTGSNLQVPKFAWQTLWKVMFFQKSQQGVKVPSLLTQWLLPLNLPISFLHSPSWFEVLLFVATILLKIIVIQIKCWFSLQGNPSLLIMDSVKLKPDERML